METKEKEAKIPAGVQSTELSGVYYSSYAGKELLAIGPYKGDIPAFSAGKGKWRAIVAAMKEHGAEKFMEFVENWIDD